MNPQGKYVLAIAALAISTQAVAQQVTFFGREGLEGNSVTTHGEISNIERSGLNGSAASAVVSGQWEVCNGPDFTGQCVILRSGEYPSLRDSGLRGGVLSVRVANARSRPHIVFYEQAGFQGQMFGSDVPIPNLDRLGMDKRPSSLLVLGEPWEVCDGARFSGRCVVLRPGSYPSFGVIGLEGAIASVRPAP